MGTRPVLLLVKQRASGWRVTVQNSAPKNGAAHYACATSELQMLDRAPVWPVGQPPTRPLRCRASTFLNGHRARPAREPGRARSTTAEGARRRPCLPREPDAIGAGGVCSRAWPPGSTTAGPEAGYFFFGAIIITICRPSRRGRDSITMSSPRSASIRLAISRPSS